jgi:hypothetical protein
MNRHSYIFALATLIVATWLAGCAGRAPAATNAPASDGVPRTLHTIESSAEDIIDLAPAGSWNQVGVKVAAISEAWQVYQPQAATAGASQAHQEAFSSALARVQAASAAKDAPVVRQAANDMGAAVLDLVALYNPATPADIGRLDVFERQIVLDVAANDLTAAAASYSKTKAVWDSVKPSVLSHKGQQVADKFEASLAKQATALQAKDVSVLTAEANNGLEIVDELEKLY